MIIITQQPATISVVSSGHNDSMFVVSGNTVGNPDISDYKFIADIYVNTIYKGTLKSFEEPGKNLGVFNLGPIVSKFLKFDFPFVDDASFYPADNSHIKVQLQFGEEYVDAGGQFVQNIDEVTATNVTYINSSLPFKLQNVDMDQYIIDSASPFLGKALTTMNKFKTYNDLRSYLYLFMTSGQVVAATIITYDIDGDVIGIYKIGNDYLAEDRVVTFSAGVGQLSDIAPSGYIVVSGNATMITPAVKSYTVEFGNGPGFQFSQPYEFIITEDCGRFAKGAINLYWLNHLGGFDSWKFNRKNVTSTTKTQSEYKKIDGGLQGTQYKINTWDRNSQVYFTSLQDTIQVTTSDLSDAEVLFLKDLFSSPVIFMEQDGLLTAVSVETNNYILSKKVNQSVYSLQLTLTAGYQDFRQSQ